MPTLTEGKLACSFPDDWLVTQYDTWVFYKNQFVHSCGGNKAVDFLAYAPAQRVLWLIELKDYRQFRRSKDDQLSLWAEIAGKVRDTLAGLLAAKVARTHPDQPYAEQVLNAVQLRVVLHLEQPRTSSKLFPRAYNPADIQQKMKQMLKPIDAHPRVVELQQIGAVPWRAKSV